MSTKNTLFLSIFSFTILTLFFIWWEPDANSAIFQYLLIIKSVQRGLHTSLSDTLRAIQVDSFRASITLTMISFVYGVVHAAGPGHGKVVISTYLLSQKCQLRRGVTLSVAAAVTQGLTAVVIVCSAFWLLELSMRQTRGIVNDVEVISFAIVAIVGLYITFTSALSFRGEATVTNGAIESRVHGSRVCDHNHGPRASDLDKELSLRGLIGIVLSIGIRPCSGAVIVLLLAFSLGHVIAGLFAVLAMSLGTAVTITLLAIFSVYFRQTAQRIVKPMDAGRRLGGLISGSLSVLGGGLIFILGLLLLNSALMAPAHPFR